MSPLETKSIKADLGVDMETGPGSTKPRFDSAEVKKLHKQIYDLMMDDKGDPYAMLNMEDEAQGPYASATAALAARWAALSKGRLDRYDPLVHQGIEAIYQLLKKHVPSSQSIPTIERLLKEYQQLDIVTQARKPDRQRLPSIIKNVESEMFLDQSKRQASLVSNESYFKLRQIQMRLFQFDTPHKKVKNQGIKSRFINADHPLYKELNLKYPIFFGEKGEIISIMQTHQLGKGGSGMVFLGMDMDTGKQVAVKIQNPSFENSPQWLIDIEKENLASLDRLMATASDSEGNVYTVDEYVWGRTFNAVVDDMQVKEEGLDELLQAEMALSFLEEMQKIHDAGFLHRDMRVDNMMWDPENKKAKIIDFALAVKFGSDGKFKGKHWVGNPDYIAPETFDGNFSIQSDVYATGIAIACLLTGAKDLSLLNSPNRIKKMNDISSKILLMRSEDPNLRSSIKEVIDDIRKYKNKLEYIRFKENLTKASLNSINITSNDVMNNKIKEKLYSFFIGDKSDEIKKFKKDSLFNLILASVKDQNVNAFIAISKYFNLFESKNKGYAQVIHKNIQSSNNERLKAVYQQLAAGKEPLLRKEPIVHSQHTKLSPIAPANTSTPNPTADPDPKKTRQKKS